MVTLWRSWFEDPNGHSEVGEAELPEKLVAKLVVSRNGGKIKKPSSENEVSLIRSWTLFFYSLGTTTLNDGVYELVVWAAPSSGKTWKMYGFVRCTLEFAAVLKKELMKWRLNKTMHDSLKTEATSVSKRVYTRAYRWSSETWSNCYDVRTSRPTSSAICRPLKFCSSFPFQRISPFFSFLSPMNSSPIRIFFSRQALTPSKLHATQFLSSFSSLGAALIRDWRKMSRVFGIP